MTFFLGLLSFALRRLLSCLVYALPGLHPVHRISQRTLELLFLANLSCCFVIRNRSIFLSPPCLPETVTPFWLVVCACLPPNTVACRARICEASVPKVERPQSRAHPRHRDLSMTKNSNKFSKTRRQLFYTQLEYSFLNLCLMRRLPGSHNILGKGRGNNMAVNSLLPIAVGDFLLPKQEALCVGSCEHGNLNIYKKKH